MPGKKKVPSVEEIIAESEAFEAAVLKDFEQSKKEVAAAMAEARALHRKRDREDRETIKKLKRFQRLLGANKIEEAHVLLKEINGRISSRG